MVIAYHEVNAVAETMCRAKQGAAGDLPRAVGGPFLSPVTFDCPNRWAATSDHSGDHIGNLLACRWPPIVPQRRRRCDRELAARRHSGGFFFAGNSEAAVTPDREASSFAAARCAHRSRRGEHMATPIPFDDDGGTPAWPASPPAPRFSVWRFLLALAALPPLLAFMAAASWLAWTCFRGVMGPPGAVIALVGIAALAALIRRHTGRSSAWRCALSLWWGWLRWCGLSSRCLRWRWWRVGDGPLPVLPHVSSSKRPTGHSIARTIVPAISVASHRPRPPSLERIKATFSRTTTASVARAIRRRLRGRGAT